MKIYIKTNKQLMGWDQTMVRRYKYSCNGHAWETKRAMKNYLYFNGLKIVSVSSLSNKQKVLEIKGDLPTFGKNLILMNYDEYIKHNGVNEILILQNGSYVIQKKINENKIISLFSGDHKKHNLELDFFTGENIFNKIDFKKIASLHPASNNTVQIMEILGKNKFIIKKTSLTIDQDDLSVEDKKTVIKTVIKKHENNIIMYNSGIFYILRGSKC